MIEEKTTDGGRVILILTQIDSIRFALGVLELEIEQSIQLALATDDWGVDNKRNQDARADISRITLSYSYSHAISCATSLTTISRDGTTTSTQPTILYLTI